MPAFSVHHRLGARLIFLRRFQPNFFRLFLELAAKLDPREQALVGGRRQQLRRFLIPEIADGKPQGVKRGGTTHIQLAVIGINHRQRVTAIGDGHRLEQPHGHTWIARLVMTPGLS